MDEFDETTLRRLYDALSSDEPRPASDLGRAANLDAGRVKAAARALRRRGALVAGGDRTGYRRILPPPLDAAAVTAAVRGEVGGEIRRLDVVATTMDAARAWAAEGAPHGAVVLADAQTAGRGRQGRAWASPPQLGLYFSVILSPGRPRTPAAPLFPHPADAGRRKGTVFAGALRGEETSVAQQLSKLISLSSTRSPLC